MPAMGLAGAMLIALLMPAVTIPTAWVTLRRAPCEAVPGGHTVADDADPAARA